MTKLYYIAGHGAGDPGACANGYQEAERVRALGARLKELGGDQVILGDFNRNYYADGGFNSISVPGDAAVLEGHLDSFGGGARGGHVEVWHAFDADGIDNALADLVSGMFPGRADRIRKRDDLMNMSICAARGINYRLVEFCFITSAEDMAKFNAGLDALARGILAAFGIGAVAAAAPAPSAPVPEPAHSGDTGFEAGTYRCTVNGLRVRSAPSLSGEVVAHYDTGETVNLDGWYTIADGYVWGRYTAYSGATRYIAVGAPTGGYDPSDFLVKC